MKIYRLNEIPQSVLPISMTTLRQLIKAGRIKTVSLGRRATGITQAEIERFIAESTR